MCRHYRYLQDKDIPVSRNMIDFKRHGHSLKVLNESKRGKKNITKNKAKSDIQITDGTLTERTLTKHFE